MADCYSLDGRLFPWSLDEAEKIWNDIAAKKLGFRSFTCGKSNSRSKAANRLSFILKDNAHWLNGSRHTDLDVLYEEFLGQLQFSLLHIEDKGVEAINDRHERSLNARITFWRYLDPDLRAMKALSDERLGISTQDNIQDLQRRKRKAEIIRDFNNAAKEFARQAAYLAGSGKDSNRDLEMVLELARQAMWQATNDLDDLKWQNN